MQSPLGLSASCRRGNSRMRALFFVLFALVCSLGAYQVYLVSQIPEKNLTAAKEVSPEKFEDIRAVFAEKEQK